MYEVMQIQSRHSEPRRKAVLSNQFHDPAALTLEKELPVAGLCTVAKRIPVTPLRNEARVPVFLGTEAGVVSPNS